PCGRNVRQPKRSAMLAEPVALPACVGRELDDDGMPWYVYADGTRLRVIAGGADDDPDADDPDADDPDADDKPEGDEGDDDPDADEDDPVKLKAEVDKWKRLSRKNEKAAKAARREAADAKKTTTAPAKKKPAGDGGDEDAVDPEQIREEERAEAKREGLRDRALDKVEAKAGKLFKDPEDARLHLAKKVDEFIDGDEIDADAITEALNELLEDKPHLAASKKRFSGDGDGGVRKNKEKKSASL